MSKVTLIVMLLTIISKVFGFLRISIVNAVFGSGPEANVFHTLFDFPTTLMSLSVVAIINSMIPIYSSIERTSKKRAEVYVSNLFNIVFILAGAVSLIVFLFPGEFVRLFYSFTTEYEVSLAISFMRITAFGTLCLSISNIMSGYLNLMRSFVLPASLSVVMNVIIITGVLLADKYHFAILPVSTLIALLTEALMAFFWAAKKGFRVRPIVRLNVPSIRKTFRMSLPIATKVWMNQLALSVGKKIGTGISTGTMVYYSSATIIATSVQGVFATSIMNVMYPTLSRQAANDDIAGVKKSVRDLLTMMAIFVIPIMVGGIVIATPLMQLLYQRGAFVMSDVIGTSDVFIVLALGFYSLCITETMVQVFYSLRDSATPLRVEVVTLLLRIVLLVILVRTLGAVGLALVQVIINTLKSIIFLVIFKRKHGGLGFKLVINDFAKITGASVLMGTFAYFAYAALITNLSNNVSVIIVLLLSVLVYLIFILFSKIEVVQVFLRQFQKRVS